VAGSGAAIWLLVLAGERPKQKPLGRGRVGDNAAALSSRWTIEIVPR
jgi:hypothetical protein